MSADASPLGPPADQSAGNPADDTGGDPGGDFGKDSFDESLTEELAALVDDGLNYAAAELVFQKTRAALAGRAVGVSIACLVLAVVLLHIAFLALAVGLVIALAPLVTIWGAIAIVVGALLGVTILLGLKAKGSLSKLGDLFASHDKEDAA
jgi:hypothetical protein